MRSLRAEYLAAFGLLPGVALCAAHDGELDDEEVARIGVASSPGVLVTCLGLEQTLVEHGPPAGLLRWVAVVLVRPHDAVRLSTETPYASAGDLAGVIALRIVSALETVTFGGLDRPSDVRASNLLGAKAARRGYAIWAVTWLHAASLSEGPPAALDPLALIHTDADFAVANGIVDITARAVLGDAAAPLELQLVAVPELHVFGDEAPVPGAPLAPTPAAWTGARSVAYALLRDGDVIATGSAPPPYVITDFDVGTDLVLRSVAVDELGGAHAADSDPLTVEAA